MRTFKFNLQKRRLDCMFAKWSFLVPLKPAVNGFVSFITPWLIFAQLLLTFCKIDIRELRPKRWHLWLLLIQACSCALAASVLLYVPMGELSTGVWQGMMVCLICPTATAAAVITGKLGGNAATLTTYTLFSNLLGAVMVPLVFPLVEPHEGLTFWNAFFRILSKVFPLLLSPLFVALFLKYYVKNEDTGMIYADPFLTLTDAFQFAWSQEDKTGNTCKVYREDQI